MSSLVAIWTFTDAEGSPQESVGEEYGIGSALCSQVVRNRIWNPAMYVPVTCGQEMRDRIIGALETGCRREVKLIANGVQPEYLKRGGYLTASCKAKLKELDLHWHNLRHECASRWLECELDVREIQILLGHATLEITQRYLNITDVGVVRSMREYWGKERTTGRANG